MVQEISFHIVKVSDFFCILRLFMVTTNLFVIANVKQLRTGGSFRILLPFFRTCFNSFHNRVEFGTILGGGALTPNTPRCATAVHVSSIGVVSSVGTTFIYEGFIFKHGYAFLV